MSPLHGAVRSGFNQEALISAIAHGAGLDEEALHLPACRCALPFRGRGIADVRVDLRADIAQRPSGFARVEDQKKKAKAVRLKVSQTSRERRR
jgi:hypothetical protein